MLHTMQSNYPEDVFFLDTLFNIDYPVDDLY